MSKYNVGDVLLINNGITEKQFEIVAVDGGIVHLTDSVLGIRSTEKYNKISELIVGGKAKFLPRDSNVRAKFDPLAPDFTSYSEEQKQEARRRIRYVTAVIEQNISTYTPQTLTSVISTVSSTIEDKSPPSWRTLVRWLKAFRENEESIRGLIPNHRSKGNTNSKIDSKIEPYIKRAIDEFKRAEKPSISAVYRDLKTWIHYDNSFLTDGKLKVPSLVTLAKRIQKSAPYETSVARNGKRLANIEYKLNQSAPKTSFILQRTEIDHTLLDIFVVDEENRMLMGRPWITAIIDKHSRCILGCHIGFEPPSYLSVAKALRNAILPKKSLLSNYPSVQHEWPCFGIPSILVSDRGKEFESIAFVDACRDLNISIQRSPAKHPWYKGAIESYFKTVNQRLLSGVPGAVLSKLEGVVTDYDPAENAIISFGAFLEIFYVWVVDIYHYSAAADSTIVPIFTWNKSLENVLIESVSPDRLNIALSENKEVQLTGSGIKIRYIQYDCEDLLRYRMQHGFSKVLVKYDRDDIGSILVLNKFENKYFSVPAIDQSYAKGLSLYQHKLHLRFAKKLITTNIDEEALARAKTLINQIIEKEVLNQKQSVNTQKKTSRYMNIQQPNQQGIGDTSLVRAIEKQAGNVPRSTKNEQNKTSALDIPLTQTDDRFINDFPDELDF